MTKTQSSLKMGNLVPNHDGECDSAKKTIWYVSFPLPGGSLAQSQGRSEPGGSSDVRTNTAKETVSVDLQKPFQRMNKQHSQ